MDRIDFFLAQHAQLHAPDLVEGSSTATANSIGNFVDRVLDGVGDEQLRQIPHPGMNSLAWIFWHLARCEDALVNRMVAGQRQVLDDAWFKRLGVPFRDVGTGMTAAEVQQVSAEVDLRTVLAYRTAVGRRTREVAQRLAADAWDEVIERTHFEQATADGAIGPNAAWLEQSWVGKTRGFMLGKNAITHNALHLGEALAIRSQLGLPATT